MESREELFFVAQLNDNAERYEDMVAAVRKIVDLGSDLNERERELLASAYKYVIGQHRNSWRIASAIEQRENSRSKQIPARISYCKAQREVIEAKFREVCAEVQKLIDEMLIPKAADATGKVFFYKMKGDYYRYLCEICVPKSEDLSATAKLALDSYAKATEEAGSLPETDTVRLGLALNFSVFYFEIEQNVEKACQIAQTAFDAGINKLKDLNQDDYKEASQILSLIRDNLTLWKPEEQQDPEAEQ